MRVFVVIKNDWCHGYKTHDFHAVYKDKDRAIQYIEMDKSDHKCHDYEIREADIL